jgi:hypothetical protein
MRNKRLLVFFVVTLVTTGLAATAVAAQMSGESVSALGKTWRIYNRVVTEKTADGRSVLQFDEKQGDGLAWLPDMRLSDGTIECDVHGRDLFQRSFVGVAFHGLDENTFEAVYFRPFNFRATDEKRRNHAVQYIAHPTYTWQKLRAERPEEFENPIDPPPDPNAWFHVRIVLAHPKVSVFVNHATAPCLEVEQLSDRQTGWVGFWAGNGSPGDFANLKITPAN